MKLEYKILWLDDKISDFIDDDIIEEVETYLIKNGFSPEIITTDNSTDFFSKLDDSYDLILTDFHMNDINGDKVVETVRKGGNGIMTEILFYTAQAELEDTKKISRVSFLETKSRTGDHIEIVLSELKKLIDLTIAKTQNLNNLRGLIMAETSEIDKIMRDILIKSHTKYSFSTSHVNVSCLDPSCLACDICKKIDKEFRKGSNLVFKLRKNGTITNTINSAMSGSLHDAIISFLDSPINITTISSILIKDYRNDIKRNLLAHYPEEKSTSKIMVIKDESGMEHKFDDAKFKIIRKKIRDYKIIFEKIRDEL